MPGGKFIEANELGDATPDNQKLDKYYYWIEHESEGVFETEPAARVEYTPGGELGAAPPSPKRTYIGKDNREHPVSMPPSRIRPQSAPAGRTLTTDAFGKPLTATVDMTLAERLAMLAKVMLPYEIGTVPAKIVPIVSRRIEPLKTMSLPRSSSHSL